MLGPVGRIAVFVLVFLVAALALRVLFVDAHNPDELEPLPKVATLPIVIPQATKPALEPKPPVQVIDSDPDLDQTSEPPDCQGSSETPVQNEPAPPEPH
jgi:hypothetical protein